MTRVLIIDDDALYRRAIRLILEEVGMVVYEAEDGPAGLALARPGAVDVVLCDQRMHPMRGDAVLAVLKAGEGTRNIPVILMTGNPAAAREATAIDADHYLAKPFTIEALLDVVRQSASG